MPNLNRVLLMGNLTRDPDLKYLPSNTPVVGFGLAINRKWRSNEGEQREETTFVDCSAFGRTAELINQYMKKGRPLFVDGRLRLEQWQDRESGANRSKLSVVVENFQFIDSRGGDARDESGEGGGEGSQSHDASNAQARQPVAAPQTNTHQSVDEAEIPF